MAAARSIFESSIPYATGLTRSNIERALITAGVNMQHVEPGDLDALEDFHTLGRIATEDLAALIGINGHDKVLDAGSGIGGTSRFLAHRYGCTVTAIDLTGEYCETARWLNRLVGLDGRISVQQGDVTELPFTPASFNLVISQHVQMNVADKARLYEEARRVLVVGGRLAIWDIVAGSTGPLDYPLPWADRPELSRLVSSHQLRTTVVTAGFRILDWDDLTEKSVEIMGSFLLGPPAPLGLHTFVDRFAEKADNLTRGLASGRFRVIRGLAEAIPLRPA